jgi:hypothetical protein
MAHGPAGFIANLNRRLESIELPPEGQITTFAKNADCRRQDLNLHTLNEYQVLNLARLPIPPLRLDRTR